MSLFLLVFFLLYGGVHLYLYVKLKYAFALSALSSTGLAIFLVLMVLAPLLVRVAEREGLEVTGRVLAVVGYTWMGFIFLFFSLAITLDLYHALLSLAGKLFHFNGPAYFLSSRGSFLIACGWGVLVSLYGVYEAQNIRAERIEIRTAKLSAGMDKLTIVQISDVHLGLMVRHGRVSRIIELIEKADPDIVVSTGDLVDGQLDGVTDLAQYFRNIRPRFGKYAVTGNHEFYAGLKSSLLLTREAEFRVLRNEAVEVGERVLLVGVDDPAVKRGGVAAVGISEQSLLGRSTRERFTILLKHRPVVDRGSLGMFDLQLSGHVHKGQIFPFNLLTYLFYPVKTGLSQYSQQTSLYVSRGTGTWGPPIRFLAPPEITVIELIPAPADK